MDLKEPETKSRFLMARRTVYGFDFSTVPFARYTPENDMLIAGN